HKPESIPAPRRKAKPTVSFTQLYELISTEVNKRSDSTVAVYERLLAATREELESTRRNNRLAWSVGGVMTAVTALGAVYAVGEVSSTQGQLGALKQQVLAAQQSSADREQLHAEIAKVKEATARVEIDALKSRLDQALSLSSERDQLRVELAAARKAKQDVDAELRLVRAAATTQPVSDARNFLRQQQQQQQQQPKTTDRSAVTASSTDRAGGAERNADVWSVLLNGRD
ncbi:MAG TPA: hypothetical protein VH475_25600, partial [Tepidisphaeraceae bacterium]